MKRILLPMLFLTSHAIASAPAVPTGTFDCRVKTGFMNVNITEPIQNIFYLHTHASIDDNEITLDGPGMIHSQRLGKAPVTYGISLAGSNFQLYYDAHGGLGTTPDKMNCEKKGRTGSGEPAD